MLADAAAAADVVAVDVPFRIERGSSASERVWGHGSLSDTYPFDSEGQRADSASDGGTVPFRTRLRSIRKGSGQIRPWMGARFPFGHVSV